MAASDKYYIVKAEALPEIYLKVAEAKELLSSGNGRTVAEVTKLVGISRSAFYKYKDSISPLQNLMSGRIITFQLLLQDKAGVLSNILTIFATSGANILTINQSIPQNGCAVVTISAETGELHCPVEALLHDLKQATGAVSAEIVAG